MNHEQLAWAAQAQREIDNQDPTALDKAQINAYVNGAYITPAKLAIIARLVRWAAEPGMHDLDSAFMAELGYTGEYDRAKPQVYMDKLREMGVPQEMLELTVWWYPARENPADPRPYERLSSIKCKIIDKLLKS